MSTPYKLPQATTGFPNQYTLTQFIQTVLVGISGLSPDLVRPDWQVAPPKMPELNTNWIAYGIKESTPNANAYTNLDDADQYESQRHQDIKVQCSFYGPQAIELASLVTDGFQIPPNLQELGRWNMGYVSTGTMLHVPDLVNERWVDRIVMEVNLRREVIRRYGIPNLVSASGIVHTVLNNDEYSFGWQTPGGP